MYWSDSGELACLASDESYYILRYHADVVQEVTSTNQGIDEDGIEAAFEVSEWGMRERERGRGRGERVADLSLSLNEGHLEHIAPMYISMRLSQACGVHCPHISSNILYGGCYTRL